MATRSSLARVVVPCLALVLASGALGGCGWTAKLDPPVVALPPSFPATASNESMISIADLPWWRYFDDPALTELIRTGLANNQNLAIAAARIDQAAALVTEAQARALPQVALALTTTPGASPKGGLSSTFFGGVNVSWQLDFWGRYHAAAQASREAFFASRADREAAVQALVASIASTWFQLKSVEQQIAVAEDNAASADASRRITELRTRHGVSSAVELHQAETQLFTVRDQIPALRATAAQLEDALAVLIGRNPGEWAPPDATLARNVATYPEPPLGLPSALLARRPDLVAAEDRLRAAGYGVASARATLLPAIGLTFSGGRSSTELTDLLRSGRSVAIRSVGPAGDQPVFVGGALKAEVKRTTAARVEAEATYRGAVLSALQNVNDGLAAYRLSGDRMREAERLETAAKATEHLARERFAAGVTGFLEVLDSQRELYRAQLEVSSAEQFRNQAAVDLYRSLGGGWARGDDPTPPPAGRPGNAQ
jgi:multidrug efflux system outer membrane protein